MMMIAGMPTMSPGRPSVSNSDPLSTMTGNGSDGTPVAATGRASIGPSPDVPELPGPTPPSDGAALDDGDGLADGVGVADAKVALGLGVGVDSGRVGVGSRKVGVGSGRVGGGGNVGGGRVGGGGSVGSGSVGSGSVGNGTVGSATGSEGSSGSAAEAGPASSRKPSSVVAKPIASPGSPRRRDLAGMSEPGDRRRIRRPGSSVSTGRFRSGPHRASGHPDRARCRRRTRQRGLDPAGFRRPSAARRAPAGR